MDLNSLDKRESPDKEPANADSSLSAGTTITGVQGGLQWHTMACNLILIFEEQYKLAFVTSEYLDCCKMLNKLVNQSFIVFEESMKLIVNKHRYLCEELLTLHLELMLRYMAALGIPLSDVVTNLYNQVQEKN